MSNRGHVDHTARYHGVSMPVPESAVADIGAVKHGTIGGRRCIRPYFYLGCREIGVKCRKCGRTLCSYLEEITGSSGKPQVTRLHHAEGEPSEVFTVQAGSRVVRVGLVGCGRVARVHAEALKAAEQTEQSPWRISRRSPALRREVRGRCLHRLDEDVERDDIDP